MVTPVNAIITNALRIANDASSSANKEIAKIRARRTTTHATAVLGALELVIENDTKFPVDTPWMQSADLRTAHSIKALCDRLVWRVAHETLGQDDPLNEGMVDLQHDIYAAIYERLRSVSYNGRVKPNMV